MFTLIFVFIILAIYLASWVLKGTIALILNPTLIDRIVLLLIAIYAVPDSVHIVFKLVGWLVASQLLIWAFEIPFVGKVLQIAVMVLMVESVLDLCPLHSEDMSFAAWGFGHGLFEQDVFPDDVVWQWTIRILANGLLCFTHLNSVDRMNQIRLANKAERKAYREEQKAQREAEKAAKVAAQKALMTATVDEVNNIPQDYYIHVDSAPRDDCVYVDAEWSDVTDDDDVEVVYALPEKRV